MSNRDKDHEQAMPFTALLPMKSGDPLRHSAVTRVIHGGGEQNDGGSDDFYAEHKRRERAYQWHRRWAMPTYEVMKRQVENSPGLDISVEDVDLLPWGHSNSGNKSNQQLNNAEYHRLQMKAALAAPRKKNANSSKAREDEARAKAEAAVARQEEARRLAAQEAAAAKQRQEEEEARRLREQEVLRKRQEEEERLRREEEVRLAALEEERQRRRQQPPAVNVHGTSSVERAYKWFDLLATPTKENMERSLEKTQGMDITLEDINALPWNPDGKGIDFPHLHDLLEEVTGEPPMLKEEVVPSTPARQKEKIRNLGDVLPSTPKSVTGTPKKSGASQPLKNIAYTPRSTKGTLSPKSKKSNLWNALDEDERLKRKAFGWYLTLARPSRHVMQQILSNTTGVGTDTTRLSLLPWSEDGALFVEEAQMVLPSMFGSDDEDKRKRQVARRANEDKARAQEAAELVAWQKDQPPAPPVPPRNVDGDVTTAYRWFQKLGGPSKATFKAVLEEAEGVPVTEDQLNALPWTHHDQALDNEALAQLLQEEEAASAAIQNDSGDELPFDPVEVAAILRAYRAYKELGIPKYITFTSIVDNTAGLDVSKDDVSLLPWDNEMMMVDEDRIQTLEQRLQDHLEKQKLKEAAKKKRAEERRKRQEAVARKQQEDAERRKRIQEGNDGKKAESSIPLHLRERMSLREVEFKKAKDRTAWEESRTLKAYAWYTRMSGPNRDRLKKIVASMKECDIVPEDVELLPWSPSGGWVDHIKIEELSSRRKDVIH